LISFQNPIEKLLIITEQIDRQLKKKEEGNPREEALNKKMKTLTSKSRRFK